MIFTIATVGFVFIQGRIPHSGHFHQENEKTVAATNNTHSTTFPHTGGVCIQFCTGSILLASTGSLTCTCTHLLYTGPPSLSHPQD